MCVVKYLPFLCCFPIIHVLAQIPVLNNGNDDSSIPHLQFIASLQLVKTEDFICAGVFINHKVVLTVATCFYQSDVLLDPEEVLIVAGSQFRQDRNRNTFSSALESILLHESFSRSSLENNLAVGVLENSIVEDNIRIIALHEIAVEPPTEGTKCQIYGWSLTKRLGGSPHLLSDEVEIEPRDACDVPTNKVTSTTICAGPYHVNGCETDSGSPLLCSQKLHGLIDYRSSQYCSVTMTNRLGTYVDLSEFHEWIVEQASSGRKFVFNIFLIAASRLIIVAFK